MPNQPELGFEEEPRAVLSEIEPWRRNVKVIFLLLGIELLLMVVSLLASQFFHNHYIFAGTLFFVAFYRLYQNRADFGKSQLFFDEFGVRRQLSIPFMKREWRFKWKDIKAIVYIESKRRGRPPTLAILDGNSESILSAILSKKLQRQSLEDELAKYDLSFKMIKEDEKNVIYATIAK